MENPKFSLFKNIEGNKRMYYNKALLSSFRLYDHTYM